MAFDITNPLAPITRYNPEDRVFWFTQNAPAIYNKYSPYTNSSIGPEVPLIYNKLTDTSDERNRIAFDNQELPIVSTIVDVRRMGKMLRTGTGIKFLVNQNYNQGSNAFNETRIYNPLSVVAAAAKTGLSNRFGPTRHMESNGILSYFVSSVLSTVGLQTTQQGTNNPIEGTATGKAYSNYAQKMGGARAGLIRFGTANNAGVRFDTTWGSSTGGGSGGFLSNLAKAFIKGMTSNIPSTNPRGAFGKNITEKWEYRPEYKTGAPGVYDKFRLDNSGFLTGKKSKEFTQFYNDTSPKANSTGNVEVKVSQYHRYYPNEGEKDFQTDWYAAPFKVIAENMNSDDINGIGGKYGQASNIRSVYAKYMTTIKSFVDNTPAQSKRSAEAYDTYDKVKVKNPDGKETSYPSYKDIPGKGSTGEDFSTKVRAENSIETKNWFAKSSGIKKNSTNGYDRVDKDSHDRYNALDILDGTRGTEPLNLNSDTQQSKDLIYFYFFDLINNKYIPFRATITSISDQNSADWEDIQYMGRADKLFVYKGFSRDVNFAFTVYANSAKEMIPMWNRINYLVGLTRPSKYTNPVVSNRPLSSDEQAKINETSKALTTAYDNSGQFYDYEEEINTATDNLLAVESAIQSARQVSGRESRFIYPPMVTFRIGDMFVDQPAVIQSVSVTIPDDTNWETLRSGNNESGTKSRQLPLKVDVSVSLKLMEKRQSLGSDAHYGKINGKEHWAL
jgi:hypothetical protein